MSIIHTLAVRTLSVIRVATFLTHTHTHINKNFENSHTLWQGKLYRSFIRGKSKNLAKSKNENVEKKFCVYTEFSAFYTEFVRRKLRFCSPHISRLCVLVCRRRCVFMCRLLDTRLRSIFLVSGGSPVKYGHPLWVEVDHMVYWLPLYCVRGVV